MKFQLNAFVRTNHIVDSVKRLSDLQVITFEPMITKRSDAHGHHQTHFGLVTSYDDIDLYQHCLS